MKQPFNTKAILASVRAGTLYGAPLRKAIERAEEMGLSEVARELRRHIIGRDIFNLDDPAPREMQERVRIGLSIYQGITGQYAGRTIPMFKKHGVIETQNRLVLRAETSGFIALMEAGEEYYTAEAIVIDYAHLCSPIAVEVARKRLTEYVYGLKVPCA
jgi:hypothetical protein